MSSRLGLVAFGILVAVVALEVVSRLGGYVFPELFAIQRRFYSARHAWEEMTTGDAYVGYKLKPQIDTFFPSEDAPIHIRTSDFGLGDIGFRDIGTQPPFGAVAVGDSFTFCDDVAVEHCWVRRLADSMKTSIADLGVSGYSNLAEARLLDRYARKLTPHLVLVGVYPNDFKDNLAFDSWTRSGAERFGHAPPNPLSRWLVDHVMAFRILDAASRPRSREMIYKYDQDNLHLVFHFERWWVDLLRGREQPGLKLIQQALLDMRATATAMGADFVVLLFPTKEQIYWDIARQHARDLDNLDVDHPLTVVSRFCAAQSIKCCDLTDALRGEAQQGRQLYQRISGHWNERGNAVVAAAVARCLAGGG